MVQAWSTLIAPDACADATAARSGGDTCPSRLSRSVQDRAVFTRRIASAGRIRR